MATSPAGDRMIPQAVLTAGGSLIGLLVLVGLAARLYQIKSGRNPALNGRTLVLLETLTLDSRRRLYLLRCGERQVVLLTGGTQDLVVGWAPDQ